MYAVINLISTAGAHDRYIAPWPFDPPMVNVNQYGRQKPMKYELIDGPFDTMLEAWAVYLYLVGSTSTIDMEYAARIGVPPAP